MNETLQIQINFIQIGRCFAALVFGIIYAVFLQRNKLGQFLAERRTWLTVVVGIGVDLLLSFGGDWWDVVAVVTFSSIGIIARSLVNEQQRNQRRQLGRYTTGWVLEDASDLTYSIKKALTDLLDGELDRKEVKLTASAISKAVQLHEILEAAMNGEYRRLKQ
jgi:hypothetical protein